TRLLPRLTSRPRPRRPFPRRLLRPRRIRRRRTGGITRIRPHPTLQLRDPLIPIRQRSLQLSHPLIPLRQRRLQPTHPRAQPLTPHRKRPQIRHPKIIPDPRPLPTPGVTTRSTTPPTRSTT